MLKVGLVGCGGIANCAHIPAYKGIKDATIVAICDINPDKFAKAKLNIGHKVNTYTDYKDMIEKEQLDYVDICTPNYKHAEIAIYALRHGLHAISEKPDTISVENALEMQRAEKETGKHLMVIRNNRFRFSSRELKAKIDAGEFGELYTGRCGWIRKRGIPGKGGWFTTKAQSGGGPLIDLGVHMIDLAIYLMGNPKAVSASGSTYRKFADSDDKADSVHSQFGEAKADGTFDVEDLAIGFIKFENGASLQIEFSWASNIIREGMFVELRGTKAGFLQTGDTYEIYDEKPYNWFKSLRDKARQKKHTTSQHRENIQNFVDVILGRAEPVFTIDQGVNMVKILTAIYESAATGKEVEIK